MKLASLLLGPVLLLVSASDLALAAETGNRKDEGLRLELQPYLWIPFQAVGDVTVPGPRMNGRPQGREVDLDLTAADLFSKLQFAAMVRAELWWNRVGIVLDGAYLQTEPGRNSDDAAGDLTNHLVVQDALAAFRVLDLSLSDSNDSLRLAVDFQGGLRLYAVWLDGNVGPRDVDVSRIRTQGAVGLNVPLRLTDSWSLFGRWLVTGPGPSWQVQAGGQWDASDLIAVKLGYRVDGYELGENRVEVDFIAHGIYLGVGFRFWGWIY